MYPYLKKIGQTLRAERKKKNLNQTKAGKCARVSRQDISEIENGQFRGSSLKIQDYAMSLGFSLSLEMKRYPELHELEELFNED